MGGWLCWDEGAARRRRFNLDPHPHRKALVRCHWSHLHEKVSTGQIRAFSVPSHEMDPLGIIRPRHLNRRPCHWLTEDWQWNCLLASSSFFRIHLLGITYVLLLTTILLLFGSSWAHLEDQVARALLLLWSIYMSGMVSGGCMNGTVFIPWMETVIVSWIVINWI